MLQIRMIKMIGGTRAPETAPEAPASGSLGRLPSPVSAARRTPHKTRERSTALTVYLTVALKLALFIYFVLT